VKIETWKLADGDGRVREERFLVGLARVAALTLLPDLPIDGPRVEHATRTEEDGMGCTQTIRSSTAGLIHYRYVTEHSSDAAGPSDPGPTMTANVDPLPEGFMVSITASIRPPPFVDAGVSVRAFLVGPDDREDAAIATVERWLRASP
jgi:hypothetical protein